MMYGIKKSVGLALAAVGFVFAQGSSPQWQNLYPEYSGLAFGDGKFVAVSADGLIRSTVDGVAWSQSFTREDGNSRRIYAAAYGGGQFIAMQRGPSYLHSADGSNWGTSPMSYSNAWRYVVYGDIDGGGFVAVDDEGLTVLYDGEKWDQFESRMTELSHAAFGAGRFVVVGNGGINSSANARGWGSTNVSAAVGVVAFGADKFAALAKNGGSAYTSDNGTSWTTASAGDVPAGMADMAFGNGKFVAVGAKGKGCWSSDGTAWTGFTLNEADDFKAVKYGNNTFLALGAKGSVYKSADGSSWTKLAGSSVAPYKQIVYGGGKFVAVGGSGVAVSSNGRDWESKTVAAENLVGVAFGDGKFVAVDSAGGIAYSANGEAWEIKGVDNAVLTSVAFGGGIFVVGGRTPGVAAASQPVIHTSADGQNWTDISFELTGWTQGQYPASLCSDGTKFLAVIGTKSIKTCDATATQVKYWANVTLPEQPEAYNMVSAAYADDKFVVLGAGTTGGGGVVFYSAAAADGWAALTVPQDIKWVRSAAYAKGAYIAVADSGKVYANIAGTWILQGKATNRNLSAVYSAEGVILAAGAGGALLYSEASPTSIRHASAPRSAAASKGGAMSLSRAGRAPTVTLSFTPNSAGTLAVYSLSGRLLHKTRLGAGERSARLPERAMSSGSVLVRYSGGGRVVSQRFQAVR